MRPLTTPPTASTANTAAIMTARGIAHLPSSSTLTPEEASRRRRNPLLFMRPTVEELPGHRALETSERDALASS